MSSGRAVASLVVAAFVIRLVSNSWLTNPAPVLDADALWYHLSAVALAEGRGYVHHFTGTPTAAWPPGYPAILAVLYRTFGADPSHAYLLNAVAGTMTCWLAGRIALLLVSARAQVLTTALVAFAPGQVLLASLVLTETLFTTMLMALVLHAVVLLQTRRTTGNLEWLAWGAGVGLVGLVRAEAVLLLAVPPVVLLARRESRRGAVAVSLCVIVASVAAQLPWLVRNARVFGHVVPASTSFGRTLVIGHNPVADGGMNLYSPDPQADQRELYAGGPEAELRVDNRLRDAAIRYALEHPAHELRLVFRRLYHMYRGDRVWSVWYKSGAPDHPPAGVVELLGRLSNIFYWLLLAAALPAFVRFLVSGDAPHRLAPVVVVAWSAFYGIVLYGSERFHVPLVPLLCVLAAATACQLPTGRSVRSLR